MVDQKLLAQNSDSLSQHASRYGKCSMLRRDRSSEPLSPLGGRARVLGPVPPPCRVRMTQSAASGLGRNRRTRRSARSLVQARQDPSPCIRDLVAWCAERTLEEGCDPRLPAGEKREPWRGPGVDRLGPRVRCARRRPDGDPRTDPGARLPQELAPIASTRLTHRNRTRQSPSAGGGAGAPLTQPGARHR